MATFRCPNPYPARRPIGWQIDDPVTVWTHEPILPADQWQDLKAQTLAGAYDESTREQSRRIDDLLDQAEISWANSRRNWLKELLEETVQYHSHFPKGTSIRGLITDSIIASGPAPSSAQVLEALSRAVDNHKEQHDHDRVIIDRLSQLTGSVHHQGEIIDRVMHHAVDSGHPLIQGLHAELTQLIISGDFRPGRDGKTLYLLCCARQAHRLERALDLQRFLPLFSHINLLINHAEMDRSDDNPALWQQMQESIIPEIKQKLRETNQLDQAIAYFSGHARWSHQCSFHLYGQRELEAYELLSALQDQVESWSHSNSELQRGSLIGLLNSFI